jgi:peroxiredoxin
MKNFLLILTFFGAMAQVSFAQTLNLDFPKLSGDTAWIYSFAGSSVDSFNVTLSDKGKAGIDFPQKGYRGMAYLYIPQKGGGEFIIAEPVLRITCPDEQFNGDMLEFPQSVENAYLRRIFQRHTYLLSQQEWLNAGEMYVENKEDKVFSTSLNTLLKENEKAIRQLDDSVRTSPLYAARFIELALFMQRLYGSVLKPADIAQQEALQNEVQDKLDINALYTSGNLWTDVHTYYPGVFVGANGDSVQTAYAASIGKTMMRLQEPVLTAFLSTALTTCERTNRQKSGEMLLHNFLMTYPTLLVTDPKLKRMLGAYSINTGSPAPALAGLEKPLSQAAVLIFFDSDCDHCRHELDRLTEHFAELTAKGYRIISIAADTEADNYRQTAVVFPWDKADRLCDFKGFNGANFKNYGIIGTPTIFIVDENGVISGKYAKMDEVFGI